MNNFRSSPYHYVPSESIAITFIVLFSLSTGTKVFIALSASAFFRVKSTSTFPSGSLRLCHFLPHVVAVSYNWSLWCTRDSGMVSSTLVKFFTITRGTIQNAVSFLSKFYSSFNNQTNGNINRFRIVATIFGAPFKMQSVFFKLFFNSPTTNGNINYFRIVATILGPTPLLAANFVIFGVLIHRLGVQYSRLSAKQCKRAY